MIEDQAKVAKAYSGWEVYQQKLLEAIEPLSADQLELRVAPELRSVGELAAHIVATRAGWFHRMLHEGGDELERWARLGQGGAGTDELLEGLKVTWSLISGCLERWTPADMDEVVFDGDWRGNHYTLTRQWVVWHVLEHDMHHGGELSLTLGANGLPGVDIE